MTKSDNSTATGISSKISSKTTKTTNTFSTTMNDTLVEVEPPKTTKTTNTFSTTMNDTLVEVEPPNIQTNTINKFHIQNFRISNENFHKWYSDLKLFLDSEVLPVLPQNSEIINSKSCLSDLLTLQQLSNVR